MANENGDEVVQSSAARPSEAYESPGIAWQQRFDMRAGLASACGKIGGSGEEQCESTPAS